MDIRIDRTSPMPLYRQIVRQVKEMIVAGGLPTGFRLPPERRLAKALGVNRSTVVNAYAELAADGLVAAHVGRGTTVQPFAAPVPPPAEAAELPWRELFREWPARTQDPLLRDLLELTEREDVISLSIGLPAPELLPVQEFQDVLAELIEEIGPAIMLHCPTEGITPLREALAEWLAARGICSPAAEVLVLSGSQQGLDLMARAFLNPGDAVVVEEPSYFGALQAFRGARARLVGVPTDRDGMRTDLLGPILERHRPKLIYTLPTYQNPSGAVLSLERRRRLLDLAAHHEVPVIEDDPYSELRYDGEPLPSLKSLDRHGLVIYLSTFSKVLFPGLRLGWLVAPRPVIRQLVLEKQSMDLHSNTPGQWVMERFLRSGRFAAHLQRLQQVYARRRDAMEEALQRHAPPGLEWQRPHGGFYFWCRVPEGIERTRLLAMAVDLGVSFLPGWSCYPDPPGEPYLRLNFSCPPPEQIREGVARLMQALREALSRARVPRRQEAGTRPIV